MSDVKITVRYFQVVLSDTGNREFSSALKDLKKESVEAREKFINEVNMRLQHLEEDGDIFSGDMIRIQTDNLPAQVKKEHLVKLEADKIGYSMAFVFNVPLSILAIQYNNHILGLSKIGQYLKEHNSSNGFCFRPIRGKEVWPKIESGELTRIKVKTAQIKNFQSHPFNKSMEEIQKLSNAPYITIELSVGRTKKVLKDSLKTLLKLLKEGTAESVKVKVADDPNEIDLLNEMLKDKIDFKSISDPKESYSLRVKLIKERLENHKDYFKIYLEK